MCAGVLGGLTAAAGLQQPPGSGGAEEHRPGGEATAGTLQGRLQVRPAAEGRKWVSRGKGREGRGGGPGRYRDGCKYDQLLKDVSEWPVPWTIYIAHKLIMFSSIAHKIVPRSCFVRVLNGARILIVLALNCAQFFVVCALNCAQILLVVRRLNGAQFILHPALFTT